MPAIAMCGNNLCPSKDDCSRFTATPNTNQWWGKFDFGGGDCCKSFIPNDRFMNKAIAQGTDSPLPNPENQ